MSSPKHDQESDHDWISIQRELSRLKEEKRRELRLVIIGALSASIAEVVRKVLEHWH